MKASVCVCVFIGKSWLCSRVGVSPRSSSDNSTMVQLSADKHYKALVYKKNAVNKESLD